MWKLDNERGSAVERAVTPRATRETDKQLRERMQPAPQHRRPSSLQRQQRREKQTVLGKKSQREMSDSLKGRGGRTRDVARSQGGRGLARAQHVPHHGEASVLTGSHCEDTRIC